MKDYYKTYHAVAEKKVCSFLQVVTAHAVKVPVTSGLNANIPGFLPVHCVYHQLKSRMFTKHKVPIKDWIYK